MHKTIEEYIASFPDEVQVILQKIHNIIKEKAPEAAESISYGMPTFKTHGKVLIYFAAYKNHIGFYATPSGHDAFAEELSVYRRGRGSVQFPLDREIPYDLIGQIVEFRVIENSSLPGREN